MSSSIQLPKGFSRWRDLFASLTEQDRNKFIDGLEPHVQASLAGILYDEALKGAKDSMHDYISILDPVTVPHTHHNLIIKQLERIANGEINRLMIFAPPGSAKSTYASVLFPSWVMGRQRTDFIGTCHTDDLATDFSKRIRKYCEMPEWLAVWKHHFGDKGVGLDPATKSAGHWRLLSGSQYFASGVGGAIAGRRSDIGMVDDPIKSRKDSLSVAYKKELWDWYLNDFRPRLKPYPHGRIIIIMTRWVLDDLPGRILECEDIEADNYYDGSSGWYWDKTRTEQWLVINLPALATENDVLGRAQGERLWPEWFPSNHFEIEKEQLGSFNYSALFQGTPIPQEGGIFERGWFTFTNRRAPHNSPRVRFWDTASSIPQPGRNDPDYTVGHLMARHNGQFYCEAQVRFRGTPAEVKARVKVTSEHDGSGVKIRMEQEPGSSGKSTIDDYARNILPGKDFRGERTTGNKVERAENFSAAAENGNVFLVRGPWNGVFLDELERFPMGAHDDQTDAASGAHKCLSLTKKAGTWGRK